MAVCFKSFIASFNGVGSLCPGNVRIGVRVENDHNFDPEKMNYDSRYQFFWDSILSLFSDVLRIGIQRNVM